MGIAFQCDLCSAAVKQTACSKVVITKGKKIKELDACPTCTSTIWNGRLQQNTIKVSAAGTLSRDPRSILDDTNAAEQLAQASELVSEDSLDEKINEKIAERKSLEMYKGNVETAEPMDVESGNCVHYNKRLFYSPSHAPYYKCKDCGQKVAYKDNLSARDMSDLRAPAGTQAKIRKDNIHD